jgi:hypothetical protein
MAGLEPRIEKECPGSVVMDLADDPEPRMAGLAGIEHVLVAVDAH